MSDGFPGKPKILKGAFVEYGLSVPPLFVVFQFNPEQLSRSRSVSIYAPGDTAGTAGQDLEDEETRQSVRTSSRANSLRSLHRENDDLLDIREKQQVDFQEEAISFDIRLDATDELNDGEAIASMFGVLPRLSTLELMMHSKEDSLLGGLIDSLTGDDGFKFTAEDKPPIVLFVWGYTRVLPVNINSMSITETEFNRFLSPTRATVNVNMTVIEGKNLPHTYSKALKEAMSLLNLANIADLAQVIVPG